MKGFVSQILAILYQTDDSEEFQVPTEDAAAAAEDDAAHAGATDLSAEALSPEKGGQGLLDDEDF